MTSNSGTKITYLLGAGASFGTLPLVKEIPVRLRALADKIRNGSFFRQLLGAETNIEDKIPAMRLQWEQFAQDCEWLATQSQSFGTVDTLAKQFFLTNNPHDLRRLKAIMSTAFLIEQLLNKVKDRYLSFFASIMETRNLAKHNYLPDNVRIISWNYDIQLELAFSRYRNGIATIDLAQIGLNLYPRDMRSVVGEDGSFAVYKLNGTCAAHTLRGDAVHTLWDLSKYHTTLSLSDIEHVLDMYNQMAANNLRYQRESMIRFASWEKVPEGTADPIEVVSARVQDTNILIVVGYSFPFFNREIDRKIIRGMTKLRAVYFQADSQKNADKNKLRFGSMIEPDADPAFLENLKYETLDDGEQFFLPPEL